MTDQEYSLNDSATDAILAEFFRKNEDLEIEIVVKFHPDLGFQTILLTGGDQRALSGDPESVTKALERIIPKGEKSIATFREYQEKIEAAFADEDDD